MTQSASLTSGKYDALACILFGISLASLAGSTCSLLIATKRRAQFYHRLMLLLSVNDIIVSLAFLLQPILIPKDEGSPHNLALGNQATCTFLGFMMRFPLASSIYNCFLSLYFNHSLRYGWQESNLLPWEYIAHFLAFGLPISFGIAGIQKEAFNLVQIIHMCDYGASPPECERSDGVNCTRGHDYRAQHWAYIAIMILVTILSVQGSLSVYHFVKEQARANERHTFQVEGSQASDNQRVNDVASQAKMYVVAYLNFPFWITISRIVLDKADIEGREDASGFYALALLTSLCLPLQGLWDSYIYVRPRYLLWRKRHPDSTRMWTMKMVLSKEEPVTRRGRRRSSLRHTGRLPSHDSEMSDGSHLWQDILDVGPYVATGIRSSIHSLRSGVSNLASQSVTNIIEPTFQSVNSNIMKPTLQTVNANLIEPVNNHLIVPTIQSVNRVFSRRGSLDSSRTREQLQNEMARLEYDLSPEDQDSDFDDERRIAVAAMALSGCKQPVHPMRRVSWSDNGTTSPAELIGSGLSQPYFEKGGGVNKGIGHERPALQELVGTSFTPDHNSDEDQGEKGQAIGGETNEAGVMPMGGASGAGCAPRDGDGVVHTQVEISGESVPASHKSSDSNLEEGEREHGAAPTLLGAAMLDNAGIQPEQPVSNLGQESQQLLNEGVASLDENDHGEDQEVSMDSEEDKVPTNPPCDRSTAIGLKLLVTEKEVETGEVPKYGIAETIVCDGPAQCHPSYDDKRTFESGQTEGSHKDSLVVTGANESLARTPASPEDDTTLRGESQHSQNHENDTPRGASPPSDLTPVERELSIEDLELKQTETIETSNSGIDIMLKQQEEDLARRTAQILDDVRASLGLSGGDSSSSTRVVEESSRGDSSHGSEANETRETEVDPDLTSSCFQAEADTDNDHIVERSPVGQSAEREEFIPNTAAPSEPKTPIGLQTATLEDSPAPSNPIELTGASQTSTMSSSLLQADPMARALDKEIGMKNTDPTAICSA